MDDARVLITSVGRRGQLVRWFKTQVNINTRVFAVDASETAPGAYLADEWTLVSRIDSPTYIDELLELCSTKAITLVVPTIDTELGLLAAHKHKFSEMGSMVAVSDSETIEVTMNKRLSHDWLNARGFPVPQQRVLLRGESWPSTLELPSFIKPLTGSRSIGAKKISIREDTPTGKAQDDYCIEEFVDGDEFTVSVYMDQVGKCLASVPRQRLEVRDGEVSKALTRDIPEIEELARSVAESLPGAWGPLNIQIIRDPHTGQMWVIEINARFGGGDPLAWHAGANMPEWLISEALGREPIIREGWKSNVAMLRFDDAIFLPWSH